MRMRWRGMDILYQDGDKMLLYNQWDMGARYKIYVGKRYYYSASTLEEAKQYYDKIRRM